jgi:hypothetical protein
MTKHVYNHQTKLDGKLKTVTFTITCDTIAEKIAGRNLWPITATIENKKLPYVLAAGTRLRESRSILTTLAKDGFSTRNGKIEPMKGFDAYSCIE